MPRVRMYTSRACGYCQLALRLLSARGVTVEQIYVDAHPEQRAEMVRLAGRTSVPQVFIGERHVGGYTDLVALHRAGELQALLDAPEVPVGASSRAGRI